MVPDGGGALRDLIIGDRQLERRDEIGVSTCSIAAGGAVDEDRIVSEGGAVHLFAGDRDGREDGVPWEIYAEFEPAENETDR